MGCRRMTIADEFFGRNDPLEELNRLINERDEKDKQINEQRDKVREDGIQKILNLVQTLGLTQEDLCKRIPQGSETKKTRKPRKAPAFVYVNPENGSQIFKGIGPKPAWLKQMTEEQQEACKRPASDSLASS